MESFPPAKQISAMDELQELTTDILLGRPMPFRLGKHRFMLYPETLGSSVLISGILQTLDMDHEILAINPSVEAMRLSTVYPEKIQEILAIATLPCDECLDTLKVKDRAGIFSSEMSRDDMAHMLMMILGRSRWHRLADCLGLGDEQKEQHRIARLKSRSSGARQYGGKSVFGTLLDSACSRYGWTDRYVIWEVPLDRLRIMLADNMTAVYLSEEERRMLNIYNEAEMIDGDTADIETLREQTRN